MQTRDTDWIGLPGPNNNEEVTRRWLQAKRQFMYLKPSTIKYSSRGTGKSREERRRGRHCWMPTGLVSIVSAPLLLSLGLLYTFVGLVLVTFHCWRLTMKKLRIWRNAVVISLASGGTLGRARNGRGTGAERVWIECGLLMIQWGKNLRGGERLSRLLQLYLDFLKTNDTFDINNNKRGRSFNIFFFFF